MQSDLLNTPSYNEWRVNAYCDAMGIEWSEMDYESQNWSAFLGGMVASTQQPASEVPGLAKGPCVWAAINHNTGHVAGASVNKAHLESLYSTLDGFDIVEMRPA